MFLLADKWILLRIAIIAYVVPIALVVMAEVFVTIPTCPQAENYTPREFPNPEYNDDPCYRFHTPYLLYLSREECSFGRRMIASTLLGGVIGWERREADRPAGIRTMALVSLASCLFSISSAFAFRSGPQDWDASRISAAIPSGVGFLGAGLIFKESIKTNGTTEGFPVVHGLTTAASLWMSAAVGIACGGELYFAASYTTGLLLLLLRFGPRIREDEEEDEDGDNGQPNFRNSLYGGTSQHVATEESELQKIVNASGDGFDGKVSRRNTRHFPSLR